MQEHIDDLGLNWDSFKWRNHQPDIGRFFNIDPLASKYVYNSPYAFSENKVVAHVELEGLETVKAELSFNKQKVSFQENEETPTYSVGHSKEEGFNFSIGFEQPIGETDHKLQEDVAVNVSDKGGVKPDAKIKTDLGTENPKSNFDQHGMQKQIAKAITLILPKVDMLKAASGPKNLKELKSDIKQIATMYKDLNNLNKAFDKAKSNYIPKVNQNLR